MRPAWSRSRRTSFTPTEVHESLHQFKTHVLMLGARSSRHDPTLTKHLGVGLSRSGFGASRPIDSNTVYVVTIANTASVDYRYPHTRGEGRFP